MISRLVTMFTLDANSPLLLLLYAALFLGCGYLGVRGSQKRAIQRPPDQSRGTLIGIRIVFYIGTVVILGIFLLSPGANQAGRDLFIFAMVPLAAWAIVSDIQLHRRR